MEPQGAVPAMMGWLASRWNHRGQYRQWWVDWPVGGTTAAVPAMMGWLASRWSHSGSTGNDGLIGQQVEPQRQYRQWWVDWPVPYLDIDLLCVYGWKYGCGWTMQFWVSQTVVIVLTECATYLWWRVRSRWLSSSRFCIPALWSHRRLYGTVRSAQNIIIHWVALLFR